MAPTFLLVGGAMKQRTLLKLALGVMMIIGCSAHAAPKNEVPILVYWSTAQGDSQLTGVVFDDAERGPVPFELQTDHFRGVRSVAGGWAFHDVSLSYSGQETPLALRTRSGASDIRIDVALPSITSCKPAHISSLKQVSESAPVRTRLKAMLAARHLLELRSNVCPPWAKRDLAEIYFAMSCSLANKTSFFRISEEAKERFRQFASDRNGADARIEECDAHMFGTALASLRQDAQASLAQGDFSRFATLNTELRASADKPDWRSGLAVQGLDETVLKADWLSGLYREQQRAVSAGAFERALEANATLRNLLHVSQFRDAFEKVSLNQTLLEADRAYIETKATQMLPQQ